MRTSKLVTIMEGCDGSGKSTLAKAYAQSTNAWYVHLGPFRGLTGPGLARLYAEAMMPAVLGLQDVVLDRSWLSEEIYGRVFRAGQDRLGDADRRMLERLALRCGAVVVWCDPGWEAVLKSYRARKGEELLENEMQLHQVWELYGMARWATQPATALPFKRYDYTQGPLASEPFMMGEILKPFRSPPHPLALASAGAWDAKTILVGESFADHKTHDPLYQWPFASFSNEGCSRWLAEVLEAEDVWESSLLWVNSDQDLGLIPQADRTFIALGEVADKQLTKDGIEHETVPHPQAHKRFHSSERYELLNLLERVGTGHGPAL